MAERMLAQDVDPPAIHKPSLAGWTPEVQYLATIADRLGESIVATFVAARMKPPKLTPIPRPETALDRALERARERRHDALLTEVEEAQARWMGARQESHQS